MAVSSLCIGNLGVPSKPRSRRQGGHGRATTSRVKEDDRLVFFSEELNEPYIHLSYIEYYKIIITGQIQILKKSENSMKKMIHFC